MADSQLVSDQQHPSHGPRLVVLEPSAVQEQPAFLDEICEVGNIAISSEENSGGRDSHRMDEKVEEDLANGNVTEDDDHSSNDMAPSEPESDPTVANPHVSPAKNLERFSLSDSIFNRQMVARSLLDTLKAVIHFEDDVTTVLSVLLRLSDDAESTVRVELVDQVPLIATYCLEQTGNQKLLDVHPKYLLPLVVKHLSDMNNQVRKTSQTALLSLVEQKLLTDEQINEPVYPALVRLANMESLDHCRAEAVALMSRMATLLGKEMAMKLFLDRFVAFCSDSLILVRKMCAIHFGDMCAVMGEEITETILLPHFGNLCKDGMWGVRKACADVFVTVSCVCLMSTRRNHLAQLFVLLLMDISRWVRLAAFQALGAFISTFADPSNPFLFYDDEGNIHAASQDVTDEEEDTVPLLERTGDSGFGSRVASNAGSPLSDDLEDDVEKQGSEDNSEWRLTFACDGSLPADSTQKLTLPEVEDYNCFQYWRDPIIDIAVGNTLIKSKGQNVYSYISNDSPQNGANLENFINVQVVNEEQDDGYVYDNEVNGEQQEELYNGVHTMYYNIVNSNSSLSHLTYEEFEAYVPSSLQEIVPAELLYHYIQMTNSVLLQNLDSEIVRYCAFSFPAVALTLGRIHWPLLRNLYRKLASDMQWKVRRTLAFSIHELAAILGREIAATDLVPIFDNFIRDLDEVRIGILKHLSYFISSLPIAVRTSYLDKFGEFLEPENERNWRFRLELTQQLSLLCVYYYPEDIAYHLLPISIRLLQDRVAEVRTSTVKSVAVLVDVLSNPSLAKTSSKRVLLNQELKPSDHYLISIAESLVTEFAQHRNWSRRQTFASCCLHMRKSLSKVLINKHILPSLLDLAKDPVANVRLIVAKVLKLMSKQQLSDGCKRDQAVATSINSSTFYEDEVKIKAALNRLKKDTDRDVRQAANSKVILPLYSDSVPSATESTAISTPECKNARVLTPV